MIMMGDRKKVVSAVLGPPDEQKAEENEADSAMHAVCEEIIAAVHSKDHVGLAAALRAAHAQIGSESEASED